LEKIAAKAGKKKKRKKLETITVIILVVLIVAAVAFFYFNRINKEKDIIMVTMETDKGNIELELDKKAAPKTVENFVKLAEEGFYNGVSFHRVVDGFIVQAGDPLSKDDNPDNDGTGGPGYSFDDEINPKALGLSEEVIGQLQSEGYKFDFSLKSIPHKIGTISMANSGPNTNGSQFFIVTTKDEPDLDGRYAVFGMVVQGMDVVRQIKQGDIINKITIK